jgi:hypothetical protein
MSLGIHLKKREKEKKKKRTNVPLRNKERFSSPSSPQSLQVSKRGMRNFSKELSIHRHHPFTPL